MIDKYNIEVTGLEKLKNQIIHNNCRGIDTTTEDFKYQQIKNEHKDTIEKLIESKFILAEREAITCCRTHAEQTLNPLVMERCIELLKLSLSSQFFWKNEKKYKRGIKRTQKELMSLYEKDPNPQVEFALAKNLVYFSTKDKNKEIGTKMLKRLAERPLSKTLSEYQLKGEETLNSKTSGKKSNIDENETNGNNLE